MTFLAPGVVALTYKAMAFLNIDSGIYFLANRANFLDKYAFIKLSRPQKDLVTSVKRILSLPATNRSMGMPDQ